MRRRQILQQNNTATDLTPAVVQAPEWSLPAPGPIFKNKGGRPKGSKNKVKHGQHAR
jgi:hypothetical protein